MKNILILGDSWGVPNYYGPPGVAPEYHTEFLLRDLGYTVTNCAANGGSNIDSIERAFKHAANAIVWFHTDLTRDIDLVTPTNLIQTVESLGHLTYQRAKDLQAFTGAKFIVIGACATIHPLLFEYITPDYYVIDWVNNICDVDLPPLYTSYKVTPKVYKGMKEQDISFYVDDSKQILLEQYTNELNRLTCMKRSGHFPDGGHPGIKPHADLVNTLKNTLP
jgi:hypothetical protein